MLQSHGEHAHRSRKYFVHDRIFGIGEDYWVDDEHGRHAFLVDGKALRLWETFELKDTERRVLVTIRKKMVRIRDTMTIERDDQPLATIKRKRLSLLRHHYRVELVDGTELDVSGKLLDREFAIEYDGELLAEISRRWLTVRETYGVNVIRDDADPALLIAVAVSVIRMAEREREDD
ncbi:LURP-one-related family protein [Streptomyces sp. NPDC001793]|uniref:LURP-one-related/scramblase family protein n=1 Tax=Streptomyces sp. NPDC001793 TaxID=3154657 RepID=UPI003325C595